MKKKVTITILLVGYLLIGKAQSTNFTFILNNNSIKYYVGRAMGDFENGDFLSKDIIVVTSIDSIRFEYLKSLDKSQWLKLINDNKTDWAANLFLYQLHKKEALFFKYNITRNDWLGKRKKEDIEYWEKNLK